MSEFVSLPVEPTREMLSALAGHPALLAASVEESAREAYAALLSAAPLAATEWRPMESAPKDGTRILMWQKGRISEGYWRTDIPTQCSDGWGGDGWSYPRHGWPTHWIPSPLPPLPGKEE